jgi:hypothetical protein
MRKQRGTVSLANQWFELPTTIHFFGRQETNPASQYLKYLFFVCGAKRSLISGSLSFYFCAFFCVYPLLRFISLLADFTELLPALYPTRL